MRQNTPHRTKHKNVKKTNKFKLVN
uniref:Uncharacterized protein n=1 Tax=Anguilla anguilla TaxID=7936 RepID=A0A0E9QYZ6_ANGAN